MSPAVVSVGELSIMLKEEYERSVKEKPEGAIFTRMAMRLFGRLHKIASSRLESEM